MAGEPECPAVADMKCLATSEPQAFKRVPDHTLAQDTFTWKQMPNCNSKPCDPALFDPEFKLVKAGAHVPLQVYAGGNDDARRSDKANTRRAAKGFGRKAGGSTPW